MAPKRKSDALANPLAKKPALASSLSTSAAPSTALPVLTTLGQAASKPRREPQYLKRVIGGVPPLSDSEDGDSEEEPPKKKAAASGEKKEKKVRTPRVPKPKPTPKEPVENPQSWQDIVLDDEYEDEFPIYDTCNEVREKIRELRKEPGFKVTRWLKDIGGINSNSLRRFMEYDGEHQGGTNGTYVAAYKYFEKRRIFEGKEKSDDRRYNEGHWIMGIPIHVPGTHYFFLRDDLAADYGIDAFSD